MKESSRMVTHQNPKKFKSNEKNSNYNKRYENNDASFLEAIDLYSNDYQL